MRRLALISLAISVILSGCTGWRGNYSCKGYPEGVRCKSVREVYDLTNYQEALSSNDKNNPQGIPGVIEPTAATDGGAEVRGMGYSGPMPLRTQARIIRIWVAPWESQDGRLHLPNYIYAEVEKRQWSIGEGKLKVAPQITPLEPVGPPDKGRASQSPPARQQQRRQQVSQKKGMEKPLFPEQLQRPSVQNQEELKKFQDQLTGQPRTQGGATGKEMY